MNFFLHQLYQYRGLNSKCRKVKSRFDFHGNVCQNFKSFSKQNSMFKIFSKLDRNWQKLIVCSGHFFSTQKFTIESVLLISIIMGCRFLILGVLIWIDFWLKMNRSKRNFISVKMLWWQFLTFHCKFFSLQTIEAFWKICLNTCLIMGVFSY